MSLSIKDDIDTLCDWGKRHPDKYIMVDCSSCVKGTRLIIEIYTCQICHGTGIEQTFLRPQRCVACRGTGKFEKKRYEICNICNGTGKVKRYY